LRQLLSRRVRPSAPTTMGTNLVAGARAFCNAPTTSGGLTKVAKPSIAEMRNAARLCEYAAAGEVDQLKEMLAAGDVDISSRDYDLRTALHVAAANGNAEIVEYLLQEGANNQFDRLGGLPVHDAVRNGHTTLANVLRKYPVAGMADDKSGQMETVLNLIIKQGVFSFSMVSNEVDYYFHKLGLDPYYFEKFNPAQISKHVHSFIAAKKVAEIGGNPEKISLQLRDKNSMLALFTQETAAEAEQMVNDYIGKSPGAYHVSYLQSDNPAVPEHDGKQSLQMYVVHRDEFEMTNVNPNEDDLYLTSSPHFLRSKPKHLLNSYQELLTEACQKPHPVFTSQVWEDADGTKQGHKIMIAHRVGEGSLGSNTHSARHLRSLTKVLGRLGLDVRKKYGDTFANGVSVYTCFIKDEMTEEEVNNLGPYCSMGFTIPDTPLLEQFHQGIFSGRETIFLHSAVRFAYYFQHEANENIDVLTQALAGRPTELRALEGLAGDTLGSEFNDLRTLYATVTRNPEVARAIFVDFARQMTGDMEGCEYPDVSALVNGVRDRTERQILHQFVKFSDSVTTTNLWKGATMSAIGFRLDPSKFLQEHPIPEVPYCLYMMNGYDFAGLHLRFRDISRGGVRLIQSSDETYAHNRRTQFQETYNLARTQQLKNKDIPEGGSKGTILMKAGREHKSDLAMMQYVDTLMDLVLKEDDPSIKDRFGKREVVFLGPDEGTAGYMDSAAQYSRDRGNPFWRSFTTGKSTQMGGVPHDVYGMTTRSVRAYVTGLMGKLGLEEDSCTKFITGGPDGDLGSNEILMSKEKIVGIVDGSGVLYDPEGLNREAINELAHKRLMVENFKGPMSGAGFLVKVGETDRELPDGSVVKSGVDLRNNFHTWPGLKADFFVPCGGRPGSINIDNVHMMFDEQGQPRFPNIVEGANLYTTPGARDVLQDRGVTLFKDASTNKGGVTSSSLEVLAGLAMNEKEFSTMMCVAEDGTLPDFYQDYVQDVIKIVERNARKEFSIVYDETLKGKRSTMATDELSDAMNGLNDAITASNLWENLEVRRTVLQQAIPGSLQANVEGGLDTIMERVPENYLRAIFGQSVASDFIYKHGADSSPYSFYEFMQAFEKSSK